MDYIDQLKNCKSEKEFRKLWNSDKINWEYYSGTLAIYCSNYFKIWWNEDKFDWRYSGTLAIYCSDYFNIWWNEEKFNWKEDYLSLNKFCLDYKHIWQTRYVIEKLKRGV